MLEQDGNSKADSNNDLCRFRVSFQRLLGLQGAGVCSRLLTGRAEGYVPEPRRGRQVGADAEGKVVDFPALQRVAGVVLVSLVPGEDAPFVIRSCWT